MIITLHNDVVISTHTPAWGVTLGFGGFGFRLNFNSHPRVGGDVIKNLEDAIASIFQLTPPRGG